MNIYRELDYRVTIRSAVAERKRIDAAVTFQSLAAHARIPKSYLSKVLRGGADLSPDQMFLVCDYLRFDGDARDFLQLLLEFERSSLARRRAELEQRIKAIQARHLKTQAYVTAEAVNNAGSDLSDYYLDPILQIAHVACGVTTLADSLERLGAELGVPPQRLLQIMTRLEELGLVERDASTGSYKTVRKTIHLPRESKLFKAWRAQIRTLSLNRLSELDADAAYSFTAVFTGSERLRRSVQADILAMIGGIESQVAKSEKTGAYQLAIDLFPWTNSVTSR